MFATEDLMDKSVDELSGVPQRNFLVYLDQFETYCIFGDIETTLQAIKHEFLLTMQNGAELTIQLKRQDMTEQEMDAAPVQ